MTKFKDLFISTSIRPCLVCNQTTEHSEQLFFEPHFDNKFAIVCIYNIHMYSSYFKSLQLTNYIIDDIKLPTIPKNTLTGKPNHQLSFRINSVIIREGETANAGHFLIWKRNLDSTKWLRISDSKRTIFEDLVSNLKDSYLIFLEKL
jgi:hypothetical protein